MQIVYSGPHPEVVVDEFDQEQVIVRGEAVEIPDELAARLLEQSTWNVVETPSQKAAREQQALADAKAAADAQAQAEADAAKAAQDAAAVATEQGRVVSVPEPPAAPQTPAQDDAPATPSTDTASSPAQTDTSTKGNS